MTHSVVTGIFADIAVTGEQTLYPGRLLGGSEWQGHEMRMIRVSMLYEARCV